MKINHHFIPVSPPTLQILISIQITNTWWVRASQRLFMYFLVARDPICPHSRLDTQEVTNTCVKLHDEINKVEFPGLKTSEREREKNSPFGTVFRDYPGLDDPVCSYIYFNSIYFDNQMYFLFSSCCHLVVICKERQILWHHSFTQAFYYPIQSLFVES